MSLPYHSTIVAAIADENLQQLHPRFRDTHTLVGIAIGKFLRWENKFYRGHRAWAGICERN